MESAVTVGSYIKGWKRPAERGRWWCDRIVLHTRCDVTQSGTI